MSKSPRVLLLTHRLKEYWANDYGRARVAQVITPDIFKQRLGLKKPLRVLQFMLALYARRLASRFDVVVCVGRDMAQFFGIVKQTSGSKTPIVAYQFILPDENDPDRKPFAAGWDRIASRGLNKIIVNSSYEVELYARRLQAPNKAVFVPLAVEPEVFAIRPARNHVRGVFSGGMAKRDYPTLFKAVSGGDFPVDVVASEPNNLGSAAIPDNVRVRHRLPYREFLEEMASAEVVVIPLHMTQRAAGQGTIIFAQAMGKAVVASDVPAVRDYVEHGVTGLLVEPGNVDHMGKAIQLVIENADLRGRLENASRQHALDNYSFQAYDRRIGGIIDSATL